MLGDPNPTSFSYGYNNALEGVYVLLWDTTAGMSMRHFACANIPADVTSKAPTPANWGSPAVSGVPRHAILLPISTNTF